MTLVGRVLDWFRPVVPLVTPVWEVGQHVSYVLSWEDGMWLAYRFSAIERQEGGWLVQVDSQEQGVQISTGCTVPDAICDPGDIQFHEWSIHRGAEQDLARLVEAHASMAAILLALHGTEEAARAMACPATAADLPCGIREVHVMERDGSGAETRYELSPEVPLTGLGRTTLVGEECPIVVAGFGSVSDAPPGVYGDHIDLGHVKRIDYGPLSLEVPVTWQLAPRPGPSSTDPPPTLDLAATAGGATASVGLSVLVHQGDQDLLEARAERAEAEVPDFFPGFAVHRPRRKPIPGGLRLEYDMWSHDAFGMAVRGIIRDTDRLAVLLCTLHIDADNPRQEETFKAARDLFRRITASVQWAGRPKGRPHTLDFGITDGGGVTVRSVPGLDTAKCTEAVRQLCVPCGYGLQSVSSTKGRNTSDRFSRGTGWFSSL